MQGPSGQVNADKTDPLVNFTFAHTSGHASLDTLFKLVEFLLPATLVPIHTEHPGDYAKHFRLVRVLKDGEAFSL